MWILLIRFALWFSVNFVVVSFMLFWLFKFWKFYEALLGVRLCIHGVCGLSRCACWWMLMVVVRFFKWKANCATEFFFNFVTRCMNSIATAHSAGPAIWSECGMSYAVGCASCGLLAPLWGYIWRTLGATWVDVGQYWVMLVQSWDHFGRSGGYLAHIGG